MNAGETIGIISGVIAPLSGVGAVSKWCKDGWHKNGRFLNEYRKHPFFFPMPLAKEILRRNVGEYPVSSPFLFSHIHGINEGKGDRIIFQKFI